MIGCRMIPRSNYSHDCLTMTERFNIWEGVYSSFAETGGDQTAFKDEIWLGKLTERARTAKDQSMSSAAVAPITETRDYALPVLAATLADPTKTLRILDFGGGIGVSFLQLVRMLRSDQPIDFVVVENKTVCGNARELIGEDPRIRFLTELPEKSERFDIVHCGSSIEYVDDWRGILTHFIAWEPRYVVFVNLPSADNLSFVTVQNYYGKRIPVHFWNFDEFVAYVESLGYALALKARFRGYWRDRYPDMPTANFEPPHRADYFTQLVFRRGAR